MVNGSISNLACSIPNYHCTNFGAFIKKCTIDQLFRFTIRDFVSNKNFVSGFVNNQNLVSGFVSNKNFIIGFVSGFVSGFVNNKNFVSGFVSNKNFVSGFVSGFARGRAFLTLPFFLLSSLYFCLFEVFL